MSAQATGVPIERGVPIAADERVVRSIHELRTAGKLLDLAKIQAQLEAPRAEAVTLPAPAARPLSAPEVYRRARGAMVRIGWIFKVPDLDPWQLILANGYAIADGGVVATAAHVLAPPAPIKEAYLVAVTAEGRPLPVTAVLALDRDLDAVILRVPEFNGPPLALNENVAPGDPVFCLSDPLDERGYFSTGTICRFYWAAEKDGDPRELAGIKSLRMDVGVRWAPGSSGAAVLDGAGNAVGHVWKVSEIAFGAPNEPAAGGDEGAPARQGDAGAVFQLHTAVPARGIRLLVESMAAARGKAPAK